MCWERSQSSTRSSIDATVKGPQPHVGTSPVEHIQTPRQRQEPARGTCSDADTVQETGPKYNPFVSGSDQSPARPLESPLELEEYRQLRATIRERGSLRVTLFVVALTAWAIAAGMVAAILSLPMASLLSLILLIAGFEAVHSLHVSVERIGRYLYARYESEGGAPMADPTNHPRMMWETAIGRFGAGHRPSTRPADALFSLVFVAAIAVNFLAATLGATLPELAGIGAVHALVIVRVITAKRAAAGQRAEDQKRFEDVLRVRE